MAATKQEAIDFGKAVVVDSGANGFLEVFTLAVACFFTILTIFLITSFKKEEDSVGWFVFSFFMTVAFVIASFISDAMNW